MVAWHGYEKIVYFCEVCIGQSFASTKTGFEYVKIDTVSGRDRYYAIVTFTAYTLVYIGFLPEGGR